MQVSRARSLQVMPLLPRTPSARQCFRVVSTSRTFNKHIVLRHRTMFTLRIVRRDRNEQLLAECKSACLPSRGEVIQLDTIDRDGEQSRPSTMWRVVGVTLHVPSIASSEQK